MIDIQERMKREFEGRRVAAQYLIESDAYRLQVFVPEKKMYLSIDTMLEHSDKAIKMLKEALDTNVISE